MKRALLAMPPLLPRHGLCWLALALSASCCVAAEENLLDRDPFDVVVLNAANDDFTVEVYLLDWPDRRVPNPRPAGSFDVRSLDQPNEPLRIAWSSIARIDFYEQQLLAEADRLTAQGEFNRAFEYFARLEIDYANLSGLDRAMVAFLRADALDRFRRGQHEHALAVLQALFLRSPDAPGVAQAVNAVSDQILKQQWNEKDYDGIRRTFDMLAQGFKGLRLSVTDRWQTRIERQFRNLLGEATTFLDQGRTRQARQAAAGALALVPDSGEAADLLGRIEQANPTLRVGVTRAYSNDTRLGLDAASNHRVARLLNGWLVTLDAYATAGGSFSSPLGKVFTDDSREQVTLSLNPQAIASGEGTYRVARSLLRLVEEGTPAFRALAGRSQHVEVNRPGEVILRISPPHPRPESLLLGPMPSDLQGLVPPRWRFHSNQGRRNTFVRESNMAGAFRQIEEETLEHDSGISALLRGDLHVLADVAPWEVEKLRSAQGVILGQYRLPTLHGLQVASDSWIAPHREARRALCYAIAREAFVHDVLLAGATRPGCVALSGPFPAGQSLGDPLRYAYDDRLTVRPYQPRLAALLMAVASQADQEKDADAGPVSSKELPPLVLAHPPTPVARLACGWIQSQLQAVGLRVDLIEEDEQEEPLRYDLRYATIRIGEPMTDAWPLFGPGGLSGDCSEAMLVALDAVRLADTAVAMTAALRQVHGVAHGELPLIPLWQTVDHYAFRSELTGLPRETVDLYQTVEAWRVERLGGKR